MRQRCSRLTTNSDENQFQIPRHLDTSTRCVFSGSASSSLFSSLVGFSRWFVLLLFISISEELFYSDDSRANSARDDAARTSFFE
jgi:hypothetical protein